MMSVPTTPPGPPRPPARLGPSSTFSFAAGGCGPRCLLAATMAAAVGAALRAVQPPTTMPPPRRDTLASRPRRAGVGRTSARGPHPLRGAIDDVMTWDAHFSASYRDLKICLFEKSSFFRIVS